MCILTNLIYAAKTKYDRICTHQAHDLLDRRLRFENQVGLQGINDSSVLVATPLRLTGSRRSAALSAIARLIGKLISLFIQDSIRASFVEGR
jgi:hypothetical protein